MKSINIRVADGGNLIVPPTVSADNVGIANYVRKLNMRRVADHEVRREGWIAFKPNSTASADPQSVTGLGAGMNMLAELVRPNGDRVVIAASKTTIKKYDTVTNAWVTIGSGFSSSGKRWQVVPDNGYLILNNGVDLPMYYQYGDAAVTPMYEMREMGISRVGYIEQVYGFVMCADIWEFLGGEEELDDWMNTATPYGIVPDNLVQRVRYLVAWNGDPNDPTNWAPAFDVTMSGPSATLTIPFASSVFVAGTTRVGVVNGGPSAGILGGQIGYEEGVLVTAVDGANVTLELSTDANLDYPRTVTIMRWADTSTFAGQASLQGDGSAIIALKNLGGQVMVYRETGIQIGQYMASVDMPFQFSPIQVTDDVPRYSAAIATFGALHLYPTVTGRFVTFNGIFGSVPVVHAVCDNARALFFNGLVDGDECFAFNNPTTKEIWFCNTVLVFAFNYDVPSVSEINAVVQAAVSCRKPGGTDQWMVLAIAGTAYQYGKLQNQATAFTWLRAGAAVQAKLTFGLSGINDDANEKMLLSYTPVLASPSADAAIQVQIYSTYNPGAALVALLDPPQNLPNANGDNFIPAYFQAIYFQDEITITETRDVDVQITERIFEFDPLAQRLGVGPSGITRRN